MPSDAYILPRRRRLATAARIAFAIGWTLFACEMFLRLLAPEPLMPRAVTYSDMGIRVNTPGATYWQKSAEVNVRVHINSQGMRADGDFPLDKPPGVRRIVVLGDSFGLGAEVSIENSFTTRMANRLSVPGQKVEIINLSVAGYGTADELIALRGRGFAFHPDMVLLVWHPTDLEDNVNSSLFALKDGALVRDQPTYYPGLKTRKKLERIPGYQWMNENSELYNFLREFTADHLAKIGAGDTSKQPLKAGPTSAPAPPPTDADRLAVALLKQIQVESEQHGIKLLILDVPTRVSRTEFYSEFPFVAAEGVAQFDVVSPLSEFKKYTGEKLFWERGNFHFSILGCRIVGDLLADQVLNEKLLATKTPTPQHPIRE